jgi:hypothetical protein
MRKTDVFLVCALAALAPQNPAQQPGTLMSSTMVSSVNGVGIKIHYRSAVEPASRVSSMRAFVGGASGFGQNHVLHRYMVDTINRQYFGYDLAVAPGGSSGEFTVTIAPLTLDPSQFHLDRAGIDPSTLQTVPLPNYPPPQDVKEGETVALDLLVSPDGKTKVVDYFEISRASGGPGGAQLSRGVTDR